MNILEKHKHIIFKKTETSPIHFLDSRHAICLLIFNFSNQSHPFLNIAEMLRTLHQYMYMP